jgi:hypothetical protein
MAAMKGELEQKDEAYARAHDDLCVVYPPRFPLLTPSQVRGGMHAGG